MKKAVLFLLLLASVASPAQQSGSGSALPNGTLQTSVNFPAARIQTPTASDLYCAGFISRQLASKDKFVAGGLESPSASRFTNGDAVYLSGTGYEADQQYTIVRELTDPNRYELFKGQWSALKAAGLPYQELARVKVIDVRGKTAIAQVEFSCDAVVPGDFAIPFVEKPSIAFHAPMRFDRFAPSNGHVSGRILLAKDFDSQMGNGGKVYMNIGASQGLKVGDYLRAVRSYMTAANDPVDSLSLKASSTEVTQTKQAAVDPDFLTRTGGPVIHTADMPRRSVAEIVVVGTTPGTATGMIVYSTEPVNVGDAVELDPQ